MAQPSKTPILDEQLPLLEAKLRKTAEVVQRAIGKMRAVEQGTSKPEQVGLIPNKKNTKTGAEMFSDMASKEDNIAPCCENGKGIPRWLAHGPVHLSPTDVVTRLFAGNDRREVWGPGWNNTDIVKSWTGSDGKRFEVFRDNLKPLMGGLVTPRSFLEARIFWTEDEGRTGWIAFIGLDDLTEAQLGLAPGPAGTYTPGFMFPSGSLALSKQKEGSDKPLSEVYSLVHVSPGGSIPQWIASKGTGMELWNFCDGPAAVWH